MRPPRSHRMLRHVMDRIEEVACEVEQPPIDESEHEAPDFLPLIEQMLHEGI